MKQIAKGLVLATVFIAASNTHANDFTPVLGVDYEWSSLRGSDDWRKVLPRSYPGGNVYIGGRFCDTIGLELGYNFTERKYRSQTFIPSDTFFGATLPTATSGTTTIGVKFHEVHFDLQGYLPICDGWEFLGSLGLGWVQPKFRSSVIFPAIPFIGALTSTNSFSSGAKILARVGLGAQYTFCESWGVRGMVRWKNTSSLRIKGSPAYAAAVPILSISNRPFEDSLTLSLGLFYNF